MKKTIAIIVDFIAISENDLKVGCGGSETWAIEIAKQFAKNGNNVLVFTLNPKYEYASYYAQYMPISMMDYVLSYTKVDYFFISRYFLDSTLNTIAKYSLNKNLYIVAHDIIIQKEHVILTQEMINNNDILRTHLQKIIVMSNFGREILKVFTQINNNNLYEVIGNGINFNIDGLNPNQEKDNDLFWSSRYERGLDLLATKIFPYVKEKYPDAKIRVAQYENNLPDELKNNPDIVFLGRLNKQDLYNEMYKHKVFFYPNVFTETFCITILEAILCDNELITVNRHGPATTMEPFDCLLLPQNTDFKNEETIKQTADLIINRIENYDNDDRKIIRKILKKYVQREYSWENIYEQYKNKILK